VYDNVLLAEASLRRNFQDLRFCPQDSQEDMASSSRRSLTRLQEHLPEAAYLDARGLLGQGLPYLQELLLPGGFRRLNSAGFVFDSGRNLGAAINMDEHVVFKASGSLDQAEQLVAAVRALAEEVRDERHPYAHDDAYGYLSYKPLLSGSGLHLGAVMHLPLLHFLKQARPMSLALQEKGILMKALTLADGRNPARLFLVANQGSYRLGDLKIIQLVRDAVSEVSRKEQALQQKAVSRNGQTSLTEQVWRSYGILRYARRLTTTDFLTHWSNLRLGAQADILPLSPQTADELLRFANDQAFLLEGADIKTFVFRRADEVRRALSGG